MKKIILDKKFRVILTIFGMLIVLLGGTLLYAEYNFRNSIKNLDSQRAKMMQLMKAEDDLGSTGSSKMTKLMDSKSYDECEKNRQDIGVDVGKDAGLLDQFITNVTEQKNNYDTRLAMFLTPAHKNASLSIKDALNQEYTADIDQKPKINLDSSAMTNMLTVICSMRVVEDASAATDLTSIKTIVTPLKVYTAPGFSYPNESIYKDRLPITSDTLDKAKSFFADYYNFIGNIETLSRSEVTNKYNDLAKQLGVVGDGLQNSFKEKPKGDEKGFEYGYTSSSKIINAVNGITNNHYDIRREEAYYVLQHLGYSYSKDGKYPIVSNFDNLKSALKLDYGSSEYINYSSSSDQEYLFKYQPLNDKNWVEFKSTSTTDLPQSTGTST